MSADRLEELLKKLCRGDTAAAEEVFRTYEPYLRKVVRRQLPPRLRPKFDSADIVQSVWADLIHRFRVSDFHFADAGHLGAFLVKATRNRFIDRVRQNRTACHVETTLEDGGATLLAREPRPSEQAQASELWDLMLALCAPDHRAILEMKREGLSVAEIAVRTGFHEDSVHRILRELAGRVARHRRRARPAPTAEP
jgi:RNA polymerase sigma factor (sigma-70 family)